MSEFNAKKKRAPRTKFTVEDLETLTPEFEINPSPNTSRISELAKLLTYTDRVVYGWFFTQRRKAKKEQEGEIDKIVKQIEDPTVEVVKKTPAQKRLQDTFSPKAKEESITGSYVVSHTPTLNSAKAANDVPGMLKSIVKAGNFYRMVPVDRMAKYRTGALKDDKNGDYRMLLITHYDSDSIIPEYGLGRKGIASTSDEFFICANWKNFNEKFDSIPGYGEQAAAVTDDILKLAGEHKDEFLDLIVEKLLTGEYVDESLDCKHCHAPLVFTQTARAHLMSCPVLKWKAMSAEEKVGLISCPHCHFVFTKKADTKRDRRIRNRDTHITTACPSLIWQNKQEELKKAEAKDDEQKLDVEEDENALAHKDTAKELIAHKFAKYAYPYHQLKLHYLDSKQKDYSEEEDRFIICKLHELGINTPGVYENIRRAFSSAPQFRFDWFIRSRTAQDLSKRCANLIQLIEKEYADEDEPKQPKKAQKRTAIHVDNAVSTKKQKNQ